ncbi:MAG: LD-carboxypeptidase, partial [Deltaproteobacteria bacterium]|nr:LD-carboxypeptidase [Deltaproteobacteria bacterium]
DGFLAGSDEERFSDLKGALLNKRYKAVLFSRGGYGSARLLSKLSEIKSLKPKPLMGFSDITALHIFFGRLGWITFHSPNLNGFSELTKSAQDFFFDIITGVTDFREIEYRAEYRLSGGSTEGILAGGNLSIISSLSGTRFDIDLKDRILFLEDTNEESYRIDRMLTQLSLREDFKYLRGIVFGRFSGLRDKDNLNKILFQFSRKAGKPAVSGIDAGHVKDNMILPLNSRCLLDASKRLLLPLEKTFV